MAPRLFPRIVFTAMRLTGLPCRSRGPSDLHQVGGCVATKLRVNPPVRKCRSETNRSGWFFTAQVKVIHPETANAFCLTARGMSSHSYKDPKFHRFVPSLMCSLIFLSTAFPSPASVWLSLATSNSGLTLAENPPSESVFFLP